MKLEITFGETVKKLREEKQLTLREVAESLDIDASMLGKIEKNTRKPTKQLIQKFASYFNVNNKNLTIAFLSDTLVYQIIEDEDASQILKVAEKKVRYIQMKKHIDHETD